jgi:peptidoglycan hydrolase-like protein with peptidoglycan-binding domain
VYACLAVKISRARAGQTIVTALLLGMLLAAVGAAPVEAHRRAVFPNESLGSRGINVTALQHLLRAKGAQLTVNGIFSDRTQSALAAFQKSAGLKRDGVAGASTWEKLVPKLAGGSRGEAVTALQKLLNKKRRTDLSVNGSYDRATRDAVSAFQKHMGLAASGGVDRTTWRNLLWHYVYPNFAKTTLCDYHSGNGKAANWGTSAAIAQVEAAAALFHRRTGLNTSLGEVSFEHGGKIAGHSTHEVGLDVDLGLIRKDGRHCRKLGLDYRQGQYDRVRTRDLIKAIYEAAPGRVKLIYFNDPVLIKEGLVVRYPNHSHHLHVRYCEPGHAQSRYRCPAPALASSAAPEPVMSSAAIATVDPAVHARFSGWLEQHRR